MPIIPYAPGAFNEARRRLNPAPRSAIVGRNRLELPKAGALSPLTPALT
jgi:hypothetical protein